MTVLCASLSLQFSLRGHWHNVYHLFAPMKDGLKGKHYADDGEVKTSVMKWFKQQLTEFYEAGIHAHIHRWNIAIE